MKSIKILAIISLMTATQVSANDSTTHASKASKHSVLALSHGALSTAKVASGVSAVPLIVIGSAGQVAGELGNSLIEVATSKTRLEITDKIITADPAPNVVMLNNTKERN